ncbi:MAG: 30S ribosomal protein S5 [Candidatus Aenigmatarchaeota archaeon]
MAEEITQQQIEWIPKTSIGKAVLNGEIKSIDYILENKIAIKEPEIVDFLVKDLKVEIINIGKRGGKGGGTQRIPVRSTAKVTASGKRIRYSIMVVVGNENGIVGVGRGKSKETRKAYQMALRRAKMNIIKVWRGCGSWECSCNEPHSIPYKTYGSCGSVKVILYPAPRGVGLVCDDESKKVLKLAGLKDVWVKTFGNTAMRINLAYALIDALKNLYEYKI